MPSQRSSAESHSSSEAEPRSRPRAGRRATGTGPPGARRGSRRSPRSAASPSSSSKRTSTAKLAARVDAALAAGRISAERAAKLKERIAQIELCKGAKAKVARHGMLRAAADYLGLSAEELRAQLPGTSLAALAAKQGKSVERLKDAMLAPAKERLAKASSRRASNRRRQIGCSSVSSSSSIACVEKSFPAAGSEGPVPSARLPGEGPALRALRTLTVFLGTSSGNISRRRRLGKTCA